MKLYHGTTVSGLEILRPNSFDRNGDPVLYLTDNFPYSLFYIRDRDIDFVTCGVREGGIVYYDEKFPNQLETLYLDMSGWVYEVEADAEPTKIKGIYLVREEVNVIKKHYVPDAFAAIMEEIRHGNVNLLTYEDTTDEQKALNHEGMIRWFLSDRQMHPKKEAFLQTHFPEAWQEAKGKRY